MIQNRPPIEKNHPADSWVLINAYSFKPVSSGLLCNFSSLGQSCPTLCNSMDCSTLGLLVHHQFPEFTQTHVHWVGDVIQASHPLSSPYPLTFSISQHQGLFKWVSSSHQVTEYWSFSFSISSSDEYSGLISFRIDWLDLLLSKGLSRVFSNI